MEALQEVELISLAEDIIPGKYSRLCNALGYTYAISQSILAKHLNNFSEALVEVLIKWKTNQTDTNQSRSILASILREARLIHLGDKLSKGAYLANQKDPCDQKTTPLQRSSVMAAQGEIADDLLINLAEDIEMGEQMEALGRALGFKAAAINIYMDTNNKGDRVTCKGTLDMLFDWRQTVNPSYQHLRLKQALDEANLVMLSRNHLKDSPKLPDIYSEKISDSLTVMRCREKLENKYLNELCKIRMKPWDQSDYAEFEDMHTVVTMVKKDSHGKYTSKKEILQGSVAEIFSTKINGRLPARILISAHAGRGKSTAVAKMAYDWAHRVKGSALEHLPLFFALKLRKTGQLTSIGEAIKSQLLSDVHDLTPNGLENFIRENQGICHIVLDGLDEYAGVTSSKRSLGSNIVSVMLWEEYPECRVLVTTRPHLENFFDQGELSTVYTKMEIEGFSRESSREYIDKFFVSISNPSCSNSLKVYLDGHPLINELVITPLFCLMVCHLWSEGMLGSDTTTQTELLDSVNVFLTHHANAKSKSMNNITEEKLGKIICKLGKVALAGLLDDSKKLVFTYHDFRKVPAVLDKACELGIVSKTIASSTRLPQLNETHYITIEFYHKLAQEHSAGKHLAAKTKKYFMWLKISKLDRVLLKIKANIGDYENLIRFAAGTDNGLCVRIMEAILANGNLDESERYRILLDCSSETTSTAGRVSSLVQRCVAAQSIVLKSPTVYTVVGMQNLPQQLKNQVREVKFERSTINENVMSGLWSCLTSFATLHTLAITDSSLDFQSSPPELPSVTKLTSKRVTSQSYEGLLSSLSGLKEIDITIADAERDIPQIITGCYHHRTGGQQLTHISLQAPSSLPLEKKNVSRETMRGLGLLIREQTEKLQWLALSGVKCRDEEDLVEFAECCRQMKTMNYLALLDCGSKQGARLDSHTNLLLNSNESQRVITLHDNGQLFIRKCKLSGEMTIRLWSCLRSLTPMTQLIISDSSLSFPTPPPELASVTVLIAERVTSQSYDGLFSSLPGVRDIDISIGDVEKEDISQIQTVLRRRLTGQELMRIRSEKNVSSMSRETMRGLGLLIRERFLDKVILSGVFGPEKILIDLVEPSTRLISSSLYLEQFSGSLNSDRRVSDIPILTIWGCHLSAEMTIRLWSCLRSFTSLSELTISASFLSFPPSPPELPSVTKLIAKRVTSQSYEGLLSSLPGLKELDINIDDAERDIPQITAGLRMTGGQQLTYISLRAPSSLPSDKKNVSRETMIGLCLLIREQTKNLQWLRVRWVKCTDERDLVYLIECCRHVKTMEYVVLYQCGTKEGGRLDSHLKGLHTSHGGLQVAVVHTGIIQTNFYRISNIH